MLVGLPHDSNGAERVFGFPVWIRDAGLGGLPGGELGTTHEGSPREARGVDESGGVPRCRGTQVDLSSQHDSRA